MSKGPMRAMFRGELHELVVLLVKERDAHGRPSVCVVGYDDTTFRIEGGEEFITALVPAKAARKAS